MLGECPRALGLGSWGLGDRCAVAVLLGVQNQNHRTLDTELVWTEWGRGVGLWRERVMTLTIDPPPFYNFHGLPGAPPPSPLPLLPNLLEYITPEIHNRAMFIQAQEETELNVKKQSGPALGDDSS